MVMLCYFLFFTILVTLAQGDRIILNEPMKGDRFKPGSTMNIDYTVRFEGMAKLGSASVSILYPNHTVITFLPEGNWMDSSEGLRGASASWTIPSDFGDGEYRLRISGPAVYMCSEQGNGQAPYTQCKMSIHRTRTFIVDSDDENDPDPEAADNQENQDNQGGQDNQDNQNSRDNQDTPDNQDNQDTPDIQDNQDTPDNQGSQDNQDNQGDETTDMNQDDVNINIGQDIQDTTVTDVGSIDTDADEVGVSEMK